ncbi:ABC transporter substrate-binding protein [Candidatus Arthromitus sp. SFB-turkey]|uniref:ABC transporter substrate-binding protein n=1 Tax=Candidatus Arthromitus sp. SFB-turkey TaxID=1840217 RepID=UPI0007F3ED1C|nr:ABC transporter substrate-binding protein [Candidatus Arthromitus sp. SFB-turkey]OAT88929.1 ferrichrome ABC transporter substrate-binding protein [Candidatus Arthromitus sp. SFB-turkey]
MRIFSKMKYIFLSFLIIVLFGCSNSNTVNDNDSNSLMTETITITDSVGQVEIPKDPQRIVDLSGNSDILSILGYSVIGTANSDAYDYTKLPSYLEDTLKDAKILGYSLQDTVDIEIVLELNPDLIFISKTQEKVYEQLKNIAPTVMIELEQIDWKQDLHKLAEILNKQDVANEWISQYEKNAQQKGEEIKNTYGENTTYLALLASGGQLFVFDAAGIGSILYDDMGLSKPQNLPEQTNISLPVISYEGLSEIDSDYLILVGTDTDVENLKQSPIYQNLRSVKNGNVIELPSSPYFNMGYSCIGRNIFVNEFPSLMEK